MSMHSSHPVPSRSRRRLIAGGALLASTALLLAGCSSSNSTPPATSSAAGGSSSAAALTGTVTVWDPFYDLNTPTGVAQKKVDDAFMAANPGVKINHELKGWDVIFTQLQAAVTAQKGPDAFLMYGGAFARTYERGLLQLDDRYAADPALKGPLKFVDLNRTDAKLLALPIGTYTTRIQYNKELFSKAGLDPENPPTTWDALLQACTKLKGIGTIPIAAGFKDGYYGEWITYATTPQTLTPEQAVEGNNGKLRPTRTRLACAPPTSR